MIAYMRNMEDHYHSLCILEQMIKTRKLNRIEVPDAVRTAENARSDFITTQTLGILASCKTFHEL